MSKGFLFNVCRIIVALLTVFERMGDPLISWYANVSVHYLISSAIFFKSYFWAFGLLALVDFGHSTLPKTYILVSVFLVFVYFNRVLSF